MATYLDRIVAAHRDAAAEDTRPLAPLVAAAEAMEPVRGFTAALRRAAGSAGDAGGSGGDEDGRALGVIAEVKRRSPSKGALNPGLDPAEVARAYAEGGAACLSVLTDVEFFGGSPDDLRAARAAVDVPVLRKDFTVSARDVVDARLMGADAVLLIVAALDDSELEEFHALAGQVGIDALVEVHDESELERALAIDAGLVGVNQRDLVTFEVDNDRAVRVGRAMPPSVVRVAESGIRGADDARLLAAAGFDAVLVGESVVTSGDPAKAVRMLRGPHR